MPFETIAYKTVEYLSVPSVVGHEWHFLRFLEKDFLSLGLNVELHDGAIEISGKHPLSTIVTAHADRHGLISLGDGEYAYAAQYVREIKYGENNDTSIAALTQISKRFIDEAVYAYDPHDGTILGQGVIETCTPCMKNGDSVFWVKGMDEQPLDTPLAYARTAENTGTYLKGQIDNALSLAMIYALFQNGFEGSALITTEEEIGYSWTHIVSWLEKKSFQADSLIVLDTSPFKDADPVREGQVIFRQRDKSAVFNGDLTGKLTSRADELGLPYQIKDKKMIAGGARTEELGSTELGKLILNTEGKWSGATVQIPTLEYHTSYETTSKQCIESAYRFLQNIIIESPLV